MTTTLTTDTIWVESRTAWERTGVARPEVVAAFLDEHDNAMDYLKSIRHETVTRPVVYLGAGTCGLGAGAGKTRNAIKAYLAAKNMDVEFIEVGCIGLCVEEPLVDVQLPGKARIGMRKVTSDKVPDLLDKLFAGTPDPAHVLWQFPQVGQKPWDGVQNFMDHPFFKPQTRWVLENCGIVDPVSIDEYIARGGFQALVTAIRTMTPAEVCDQVKTSGLRGRGGGGFPAGLKWKLTLDTPGDQKYFICNADEGDPGAFMDRAVIEGDPYRLIEGLGIAAYGIGATKAYIYIRAEYPLAIERLKIAIARAKEYGLLGYNILDSGFNLEIKIKMGAGAFVCGEETALIHSIEGKRGMPRPRPPYPSVRGLFDKPTAINNVETLANVPAIVRNGVDWFRSLGTESSKGTKVFALSGKITRTGLVEVAMGTTIRQIVEEIGDGCPNDKTFKAVQIGGPSGGCIPESHLDIQIDYESLKTVGAMMGSGGMVVMDEDTCMVDVAKFFMDFIQRESCGKCVPCREGTKAMLGILEQITKGRRSLKGDDALDRFKGVTNLTRLASVIQDTSLCGLGNSSPNPVLSTMRWFKDEYDAHIYERKCPAGACTDLLTFTIDTDKCIGCTLCVRKCPADAIVGKPKTPHYIVQEKCIGCGSCIDVCRVKAVVKE